MVPLGPAGAAYPAGAQEGRQPAVFHPLVNLPFSLGESGADCRHVTASKMGNGSRVTVACLSLPFRSSQVAYCYTGGFIYAGRGITVPRNPLAHYTAWHLRIRRLVQFILVDAAYHNALTSCATRVCCACVDETTCVAERYLTLRIGCSRGRTPKVVRP